MLEIREKALRAMDSIIPHTKWCDARAQILKLFEDGPNVVGLFGPAGTGKTLLLHELSRVFRDLGHETRLFERSDILPECDDAAVILIDEVHRALPATLAKLGQRGNRFIIFAAVSAAAEHWQDSLSNFAKIELGCLLFDDIKMFVSARLAQRAQPSELFSREAIAKLAILSEGVPRVLDNLIKLSCFSASLEGVEQVHAAHIEEAAALLSIETSDEKSAREPEITDLDSASTVTKANSSQADGEEQIPILLDYADDKSKHLEIKENKILPLSPINLSSSKINSQKNRREQVLDLTFVFVCFFALMALLSWPGLPWPGLRPFLSLATLYKPGNASSSLSVETKLTSITGVGKNHDRPPAPDASPGARPVKLQPTKMPPAPYPRAAPDARAAPDDRLAAAPSARFSQIDAAAAGLAVAGPAITVLAGEGSRSNVKPLPAFNPSIMPSAESYGGFAPTRLFPLPNTTPIRVVIGYPRGNLKAAARAAELARTLTSMGFLAEDPIPVLSRAAAPSISFFFAQDRDGAVEISHKLASAFGQPRLIVLSPRSAIPRPGTVEILIATP
uniref:AAA+ ATPase domain-containing protein n=1 Tax=Acidicaldus sp. TaxID=1872105 RepID=A0A8J4HDG0_9PROT